MSSALVSTTWPHHPLRAFMASDGTTNGSGSAMNVSEAVV
jgi:hypothetical protein